jgi:hypothetical protein
MMGREDLAGMLDRDDAPPTLSVRIVPIEAGSEQLEEMMVFPKQVDKKRH